MLEDPENSNLLIETIVSVLLQSTKSAQAICNLPVVSKAVGEMEHKASWERGIIDYEGEDGFENIQQHMEDILKSSPKNDDLHS